MALTELMNVRLIKLNLEAQTKIEVLSEMVDLLASADDINDKDSFFGFSGGTGRNGFYRYW